MATPNKDTIYIDIDDEITGIIDKVRSSNGKILALVLPKRASVFQSIVNMKLLKRSADNAKKHIVLITSEAGLLPLAGAVGLHVAKTLQTKPEIPDAPLFDDHEETVEETADLPNALPITETAGDRPVGELAGLGAAAGNDVETLEMDDDEPARAAADATVPKAPKVKKNKKLAIPNFDRFRMLLIVGALVLIALIVGLFFALTVLPKAVIAVTTNASDVNVGFTMNLDTAAKALDPASATLPAKQVQSQKTSTQSTPATGQKNNGDKAKGSVTITNCSTDGNEIDIPAGTGVSANGLTYITQGPAILPTSYFSKGSCQSFPGMSTATVSVTSQAGGANYNISSGSAMKVAGFATVQAKTSTDISGGTDNIVKVVSQTDIDTAKQKMAAQDSASVKQDLQAQLNQSGYTTISATFNAGTPDVTSSASVGSTIDTVTVTQVVTYTMLGIKQDDLKTLVDNDVKKQIDTSKQSILSEGLSDAKYRLTAATATTAQVALQTVATAGPDLNIDSIKAQSAGKKGGDIKSLLQATPGVTDVNVKLSPFWVTTVPKKTTKITVTIAKPTAPATQTNVNNP
jgi:hypothetical protein